MPTLLGFPDAATFRRAVEGGFVPVDVAESEILSSPENPLLFAIDGALSRTTSKALGDLGVTRAGRNKAPDWETSPNWYHASPLEPNPSEPDVDVLLRAPAAAAARWLRLLGGPSPRRKVWADGESVYIHAPECPQHVASRAADREQGVVAFSRRENHVWVEVGHRHPFVGKISCPKGKIVLVERDRSMTRVDDWSGEPAEFKLKTVAADWTEAASPIAIPFRLKLVKADTDPEQLCVLSNRDLATVVTDLADHLIAALEVCDCGDWSVLRVPPSVKDPPLQWFRQFPCYSPVRGVNGLYAPYGKKLTPTIRRSALASHVGHTHDSVTWLEADENSHLLVNRVAADAFVPLKTVVGHFATDEVPLNGHLAEDPFPFESFYSVAEDAPVVPPRPHRPKEPPRKDAIAAKSSTPATEVKKIRRSVAAVSAPRALSDIAARRKELIAAFLGMEGPPDAPERGPLWDELASVCSDDTELSSTEAHKCWIESHWMGAADEGSTGRWSAHAAKDKSISGYPLLATIADLDRRGKLNGSDREIGLFSDLERHADHLPVKGVWAAALSLCNATGDVLGLARWRDRVILRLFDHGLSAEKDAPLFLRRETESGKPDSAGCDGFHRLVDPAFKWLSGQPINTPYVAATLAYGFARTGDVGKAAELLKLVEVSKDPKDVSRSEVARFLTGAYRHRVLHGPSGLLPDVLLSQLEEIARKTRSGDKDAAKVYGDAEFAIQSLRKQSTILEPQMRADHLSAWMGQGNSKNMRKELRTIIESADGAAIEKWTMEQLPINRSNDLESIVMQVLPVSPRASENLARVLIDTVLDRLTRVPFSGKGELAVAAAKTAGALISRAIKTAAHFSDDRRVELLVDRLRAMVLSSNSQEAVELVAGGIGPVVRDLRRLGLIEPLRKLASELVPVIPFGPSASSAMAAIASAMMVGGAVCPGRAIVDQIRDRLVGGDRQLDAYQTGISAAAYASAAGYLPDAVDRYVELLTKLPASALNCGLATAAHYSIRHLTVLETMVTSILDGGLGSGKFLRDWLADDEHLIRLRIASDFAKFKAKFG